MDVQHPEDRPGSRSPTDIGSRKRGNTSSGSEDTELYSASGDESSEYGFRLVQYRKAKRRIINSSSASSSNTVKTAPQRWPHSILFVPQNATDNLRVLNRQALSVYLENTVPNEIKDVRINTRRNILAIDVMNPSALTILQHVTQLGNIKVRSIMPTNGATITGVIYDIDNEIPNADLPVLIKPASEHNVIVHVCRLGNTRCVRLTFKGDCLPPYVKVGHFRHQVRPFIPRPMQCYNCQKIGHVKGVCRNSAVCPRCAEPHSEDNCSAIKLKCPNCQGDHCASSKDCPQIKKEITILKQMVRDNSTHKEAAVKARRRRRHRRTSSRRKTSSFQEQSTRQAASPVEVSSPPNTGVGREKTARSLSTKEWPPLPCTRPPEEPQKKPPPVHQGAVSEESRKTDEQVIALIRPLMNAIRVLLSNMHTPSAKSALQVLDALSPVLATLA
ncbi:uncharacterized protein [Dermacentor albipictus]|uniref:uncharacterized protein n=1 Tax=Dermacentor albipictus TaxID=60249 RepID=UPI0031FDFE75